MMTPAEKLARELKNAGPRRERNPRTRRIKWSTCLRDMRNSLGLTAYDVSERVGIPLPTINTMENGYDPKLSNAMRLATFFGKRIEEIWTALPEASTK